MRILLRDSDTGKYFRTPVFWVRDTRRATAFPDLLQAIEESNQLPQARLEMIAIDQNNRPRLGVCLWRVNVDARRSHRRVNIGLWTLDFGF